MSTHLSTHRVCMLRTVRRRLVSTSLAYKPAPHPFFWAQAKMSWFRAVQCYDDPTMAVVADLTNPPPHPFFWAQAKMSWFRAVQCYDDPTMAVVADLTNPPPHPFHASLGRCCGASGSKWGGSGPAYHFEVVVLEAPLLRAAVQVVLPFRLLDVRHQLRLLRGGDEVGLVLEPYGRRAWRPNPQRPKSSTMATPCRARLSGPNVALFDGEGVAKQVTTRYTRARPGMHSQ